MKLLLLALLAAMALSAAVAQTRPPCLAAHYKIIPLPFHPARINNSGVVAGTTEDHELATWSQKDGLRELPLPAGFADAQVSGINQAGEVVGQVTRNDAGVERIQAFVYRVGKLTILSEAQSKAKAINNAGEIAGENSPEGPAVWSSHSLHGLGGCCGGRALALNNRGQVVGELNDREARYGAFIWDAASGMRPIEVPNARNSTALAINDAGDVLVQSLAPNAVFLREQGKLTHVELSTESASQPLALNNCDVIVGEYGANSEYYHAFVWDRKNGFRDLNKLVDVGSDWNLESALDINDRGEIVGTGDYKNNDDTGFLLVPDTEMKTTKDRK